MILSRKTPLNPIELWYPKYSTQYMEVGERVCLPACYKVKTHNKIVFTKAKHLLGYEFYLSGEKAREYQIVTNGTIKCYEVPMSALQQLEYKEDIDQAIVETAKILFKD